MPATAPTPPDDSAPLPRGAIACLAVTAFASGLSLRVNDALLPLLAREFGVSLGHASQVIGVFAVAYGLAQLFFGPVGDRLGKYRVIAWAAVASAVTTLACALAPGFDALLFARAAAGATAAAVIPLAMAWIGDVVPYAQRQPVLARFLIGQILGSAAGVWMGGFAADLGSWRTPYVVIGTCFAAAGGVLFVLQRRLPARARAQRVVPGSAIAHSAAEFAAVLAHPWARTVLLLVLLEGMLLYGPFAFIASHVHQAHGLSLAAAGAVVMLFGAGGLVFALLSRRFVAHMGEAGLVGWGGAGMALALAAIAYGPSPEWALAGCALLGLAFYMVHNTLQVNATQMAPERRGAAVSAFAACFFLGQSAGVAAGGWAVGHVGIAPFIAAGAVGLALVAGVLATLLRRRRQRTRATA